MGSGPIPTVSRLMPHKELDARWGMLSYHTCSIQLSALHIVGTHLTINLEHALRTALLVGHRMKE